MKKVTWIPKGKKKHDTREQPGLCAQKRVSSSSERGENVGEGVELK